MQPRRRLGIILTPKIGIPKRIINRTNGKTKERMTDFKAPVITGPGKLIGVTWKIQEALNFSEYDICPRAEIEIKLQK